MVDNVKIQAKTREKKGSSESRRLRRQGLVPGNIYGHGGGSQLFSVRADDIVPVIQAGQHVLELDLDGTVELTMFREVQWDPLGTTIQHVDLLRVNRNERVLVDVPVELRGISPGATSGGVLDQQLRTLSVECPAFSIPDSVSVRIGGLEIGDAVRVSELEIGEGLIIQDEPEAIVVQVNEPVEELPEDEEAAGGPAEPEVIGREDKEGADDES